jgi:DNA repair photolyase
MMILSVSRRTDIPAFYSKWFFKRIAEGYCYVRNPMYPTQVSKVKLTPDVIDCIVFWSKNPQPMLKNLDKLKKYKYYFQITITPYGKDLEPNVPEYQKNIKAFVELSKKIGKEKVIWRYDPIILTDKYDINFHKKKFAEMVEQLAPYTNRCVISFVDLYKKTQRNMSNIKYVEFTTEKIREVAAEFSEISKEAGVELQTCSESIDLSDLGITHTKCIDDELIGRIVGQKLHIDKDKNQRIECGCVASVDIGAYNTCKHGCRYCYANFSDKTVANNTAKHDDASPFLIGNGEAGDRVSEKKMVTYLKNKISETNLFE